ncbi:helix-turn-helix domain-containing protein [Amycolatopsis sp.]|uniref:helix-turn-helix domain-containing protein n=1 Tax=Amycolatopsis sp. TaxID=37632 RepID=UPI002C5AC34E|nr:helix-turn-helix domain-containing protein [Amycolatopsis sp.]HVV08956.1 helix-turn-helix domain-containing protein [Amycolatopsis sp.]
MARDSAPEPDVGPGPEPVSDVRVVERAARAAPWVLATLVTVVSATSLWAVAATLVVHHSTPQDRLAHLEGLPGRPVREPNGRLRLHLALALWRLHRHPDRADRYPPDYSHGGNGFLRANPLRLVSACFRSDP